MGRTDLRPDITKEVLEEYIRKAIKAAGHMPTHIYNAYTVLNNTAGLLGLEITGIRDKKTKKEWKRGG